MGDLADNETMMGLSLTAGIVPLFELTKSGSALICSSCLGDLAVSGRLASLELLSLRRLLYMEPLL